MKIMLCARKFKSPLVGGVDVYAERMGRALMKLGHSVSIIAVDSTAVNQNGTIAVSEDTHEAMNVFRLQFAFNGRPKEAFDNAYDPEMGSAIHRILQQQKPDLFIVLNFYITTLAAVKVAKALHIPVIHIATDFLPVCRRATLMHENGTPCHDGESIKSCATCFVSHHVLGRVAASVLNQLPEARLVAWGGKRDSGGVLLPLRVFNPYWKQVAIMAQRLQTLQPLREQIDLVFAPTQYTRNAFLENGFSLEQVHFFFFFVEEDHPLTQVSSVPAPHIRFLFIGRLQPYKGAHLLLEAFNNLASAQNATLTIYGTADGYEEYYEQLQAMMALNKRVHFGGKIAPDELGQAFAEADYFILPSTWHENSPLIVLDALQSKTPVIASDIGGVRDIVQDGINGLLFPMGDVQALQRVLQKAIDQPSLVEQFQGGVHLPSIDSYVGTMLQRFEDIRV